MVATKQLGLGLLPLLPLRRDRRRWTSFVVAGVTAGAVILPFLALNPGRRSWRAASRRTWSSRHGTMR